MLLGLGLLGLLKFRNGDKLHLSNGPGIWTWSFSIGVAAVGLTFALLATDCIVEKCICILGSLVLALMSFGKWKDCVMDRNKNLVTLTCCNWYGRLCSQVSAVNTRTISLCSVCRVEIIGETLRLVLFSNATVVIGTHSNPGHLRHLQYEVASFLRVSRVEQVQWDELEDNWYFEFWDAVDTIAELEHPTSAVQHSGVKVLIQPEPEEVVA